MKKEVLAILAVLMLASMACSFTVTLPEIKTGPEKTTEIREPIPTTQFPVEVNLNVGAAQLNLSGGADDLVNGTLVSNIPDWDPKVEYTDGTLEISQKDTSINGIPSNKLVNKWDLKFTNKIPLMMTINAGAYQGKMDLGGIDLMKLAISDGASDVDLSFSKPNPGEMETFDYNSGASNVKLSDLANANFKEMKFQAGAGTYSLDFSGDLRQSADVSIDAGVSTIKISVPKGTHAVIVVDGELKDVNTRGTWTVESNTYSTGSGDKVLNINVNMNLGSLELIQSEE
jgi:hypothetical protein